MNDAPLLEAIRAAPAPREVLADALLARGDIRGEFILVQLRLATLEGLGPLSITQIEERDRLLARQTELGELVGRVAPNVRILLHRGFAARVLLGPGGEAELLRDPLFSSVLRELVVWRSSPERVLALTTTVRARDVPLVREVVFNGTVGNANARAIAEWDVIGQLETLHFISSEVGLEGLQLILHAPRTIPLTKLSFFNDELGGIGRWLFTVCPSLIELDLRFSGLDRHDVQSLATAKQSLRALSLNGNRLGAEGARILAAASASTFERSRRSICRRAIWGTRANARFAAGSSREGFASSSSARTSSRTTPPPFARVSRRWSCDQ